MAQWIISLSACLILSSHVNMVACVCNPSTSTREAETGKSLKLPSLTAWPNSELKIHVRDSVPKNKVESDQGIYTGLTSDLHSQVLTYNMHAPM